MTEGPGRGVTGQNQGERGRLRAAYHAALEFLSREPWLQLGNEDYVLLELEGEPDPLVAVVMGSAGEEYGLMVACGPRAEAQVQRLLAGSSADGSVIEEIDMLALYVDRLSRLPGDLRAEVKRAGLKAKGGNRVPYFMCKRPFHHLQQVGPRDLRRLHTVLCGLAIGQERGWLDPGALVRPRLRLVGDPLSPAPEPGALQVQRVAPGGSRADAAPPPGVEPTPSPALTLTAQDIAGIPLLKETWLLLLVTMPGRVVGSSELLRAVTVIEAKTGLIRGAHVVSGPQGAVQAVNYLVEVFGGRDDFGNRGAGIPEKLEVFDEELLGLLKPVLEPAGVTCQHQVEIPPEVEDLLADMKEVTASRLGDAEPDLGEDDLEGDFSPGAQGADEDPHWSGDPADLAPPDDSDPDAMPAPGDLEAWKAVERRLIRRAMRAAEIDRTELMRLTARYFGGARPRRRLLDRLSESPELPFFHSFEEWYWLDYRKHQREPTLAERMLAGEVCGSLPRAEHLLLEALSGAPMSLQRVVSVEPGRSLVLEDVLRGGRREVSDRSLVRTAKPDQVFPGRVYPCGAFHFISGAALVIPPLVVSRVLEEFHDWGLQSTPAGLRRGAHLFGRLWDLVEMQPMPRLQTTDGEELVLHEATFRVSSPALAQSALRGHPDYEADPSGEAFSWVEARPGAAVDPVVLGRFRLEGDRLRFSTNSAPRWKRARAWVERALPDAVLDDLQRHDITSFEQMEQLSQHMTGSPAGRGAAGPAGRGAAGPAGRGAAAPPRRDDRNPHRATGSSSAPPLSANDMETFNRYVQQMQLRWIDERIPMFGGRTPRELVRTTAGQRRVQQHLRTLTPSVGPGGVLIEPPVAEMRRRLGLPPEDDDARAPAASRSASAAASETLPPMVDGPGPRFSPHPAEVSPLGARSDSRNARKRERRKREGHKQKRGPSKKKPTG